MKKIHFFVLLSCLVGMNVGCMERGRKRTYSSEQPSEKIVRTSKYIRGANYKKQYRQKGRLQQPITQAQVQGMVKPTDTK